MKRYIYNYQTIVSFAEPVINHSIALRCQPVTGSYMSIEEEHIVVSPGFWTQKDVDAFGNRIIYGGQREAHSTLAYVSVGILEMNPYLVSADRLPLFVYLQPTKLTNFCPHHEEKIDTTSAVADMALSICHHVHQMIAYQPGITTVETTAAEAMKLGGGVCQDFAHIMISLCRQEGIASRYVCGFLEGTGETHAWVEVFDGYNWIGFDPTHDVRIVYGYVKLAHGRDAADCPVSRGLYAIYTSQQTQINVTLKEL